MSDDEQYTADIVGKERPWRKKGDMYWLLSVHTYTF
jgi:hypothetical protein